MTSLVSAITANRIAAAKIRRENEWVKYNGSANKTKRKQEINMTKLLV